MSRLQTHIGAMGFVLALALLTGCGTPSTGGVRTLKQTDMDVSWPMTRFRNAVAAGNVTRAEQDQVNRAYADYQTAFAQALQAANNNRNAPSPGNVQALASTVMTAIAAIPF